jgi:2-C-methyl-D-erythritol 4-phosphate cytidylyltransferase
VIGVRPVTDTVKQLEEPYVGATIDRDRLVVVTSPVVLPPGVVASLEGLPSFDFAEMAGLLAARFPVVTLEAPPEGRRVGAPDDVRLLEALTRPAG